MKKTLHIPTPIPILIIFTITLSIFIACLPACSKGGNENNASSTPTIVDGGIDPLFDLQWHLKNSGQDSGTAGEDLNVVPAWSAGYKGSGAIIMIIDDGVEIAHADLKDNVSKSYTHNYYNNSDDPTSPGAQHGTAVAGVIAARDLNNVGIRGVAPRATIGANNMLQASTSANTYDALTRNSDVVFVSSNSWGADDGYGTFAAAVSAQQDALTAGIQNGRGGKGTVYVWSAGNGADLIGQDNANYDGYTIHFGLMAICAVGNQGKHAVYSEQGANLWICAPSLSERGGNGGVVTSDLSGDSKGYNTSSSKNNLSDKDYTNNFSGTSAAAPMISGIAALILTANPALTWRDVKAIIATTARKNDASDSGWFTNGAGYKVHHSYGFGVADAKAAVDLAKSWTNLPALVGGVSGISIPTSGQQTVASGVGAIADNPADANTKTTDTIAVSASGIAKLEYVKIEVTINHADWGDLNITLQRSGSYTTSDQLALSHRCYNSSGTTTTCSLTGISNTWKFGSARHFGEPADGNWTIEVQDRVSGTSGTLTGWRLTFYGTAN